MTYRLAESLKTLRAQIDKLWPKRSKISDGWIGDAAHATRTSDHNPYIKDKNGVGVVRAIDITNDPVNGPNLAALIQPLLRDKRTRYVIFNKKIYNPSIQGGAARPYNGVNAHQHHLHISVSEAAVHYDNPANWNLAADAPVQAPAPPKPAPASVTKTLKLGDSGIEVNRLQALLRDKGYTIQVDGGFGPKTEQIVKQYQKGIGLTPDGVVGPVTWSRLLAVPSKPVPPPAPEAKPLQELKASEGATKFLHSFEECRLEAYSLDGIWHIGWGRSSTSGKPPAIYKGMKITQEEADAMFQDDLKDTEEYVKFYVKVPLTQGQYDGLVSITYNKGPGWLRESNLLLAVNGKAWAKVAELILADVPPVGSKTYNGILRRRKGEVALVQS